MMKKIVLDIQSDIHAHTMERMLMQKLDEKVRQAKREGLIDAFLFGSVSENYFASVIDSV